MGQGASPATASPYIRLTVCCIAITLLREDSVARLAESLAISAGGRNAAF